MSLFKDKFWAKSSKDQEIIYWSLKCPKCYLPACLPPWIIQPQICYRGKDSWHPSPGTVYGRGDLSHRRRGHLSWGSGYRGDWFYTQEWWKGNENELCGMGLGIEGKYELTVFNRGRQRDKIHRFELCVYRLHIYIHTCMYALSPCPYKLDVLDSRKYHVYSTNIYFH